MLKLLYKFVMPNLMAILEHITDRSSNLCQGTPHQTSTTAVATHCCSDVLLERCIVIVVYQYPIADIIPLAACKHHVSNGQVRKSGTLSFADKADSISKGLGGIALGG